MARRNFEIEYTREAEAELCAIHLDARTKGLKEAKYISRSIEQAEAELADRPLAVGTPHPRYAGTFIHRFGPFVLYFAVIPPTNAVQPTRGTVRVGGVQRMKEIRPRPK